MIIGVKQAGRIRTHVQQRLLGNVDEIIAQTDRVIDHTPIGHRKARTDDGVAHFVRLTPETAHRGQYIAEQGTVGPRSLGKPVKFIADAADALVYEAGCACNVGRLGVDLGRVGALG